MRSHPWCQTVHLTSGGLQPGSCVRCWSLEGGQTRLSRVHSHRWSHLQPLPLLVRIWLCWICRSTSLGMECIASRSPWCIARMMIVVWRVHVCIWLPVLLDLLILGILCFHILRSCCRCVCRGQNWVLEGLKDEFCLLIILGFGWILWNMTILFDLSFKMRIFLNILVSDCRIYSNN